MTAPLFLDMLDVLLEPALRGLSARFVASQVGFLAGCQQPDGGFCGRQGGSDWYYTDFALRTLAWLAPDHPAFVRVVEFVARQTAPPRDVTECFSILSVGRLLRAASARRHDRAPENAPACGDFGVAAVSATQPLAFEPLHLMEWLFGRILPQGGFGRSLKDRHLSAYHTFLGALCFQMLESEMPMVEEAVDAVRALRRPDGGYAESDGHVETQTSATAAAVAFLLIHEAISDEEAVLTSRFLGAMQCPDGGLRSHLAAKAGDLLSTFTGLVTLSGLGGFTPIDVAAAARFLRTTAHHAGGFLACCDDDVPDVEYTHYGVGTLALLRLA